MTLCPLHIQETHTARYIPPQNYQDNPWIIDVYSFGIVLLRLLIGYPQPALTTEDIVAHWKSGSVAHILDPCAGAWPQDDAADLCDLALRCYPVAVLYAVSVRPVTCLTQGSVLFLSIS